MAAALREVSALQQLHRKGGQGQLCTTLHYATNTHSRQGGAQPEPLQSPTRPRAKPRADARHTPLHQPFRPDPNSSHTSLPHANAPHRGTLHYCIPVHSRPIQSSPVQSSPDQATCSLLSYQGHLPLRIPDKECVPDHAQARERGSNSMSWKEAELGHERADQHTEPLVESWGGAGKED